jgi:hypothetical protein
MTRLFIGKYNPTWGSHMPVLLKILGISEGPVLEMGIGPFSTPFLHILCQQAGRKLVSYEGSPYYFERHADFRSAEHEINMVEDWNKIDIESTQWGMAFIDQDDSARASSAARLANNAKFVVLHDSHPPEMRDPYGYREIYPLFKYKYDYTKMWPNTTVLSNFVDVTNLDIK